VQGKVIRLLPRPVSEDALRAVDALRKEILAGRVVGFAIVAMQDLKNYTVDVAGVCRDYPSATRGFVAALDDELAGLPSRA
jgi:hypothetical protein